MRLQLMTYSGIIVFSVSSTVSVTTKSLPEIKYLTGGKVVFVVYLRRIQYDVITFNLKRSELFVNVNQ